MDKTTIIQDNILETDNIQEEIILEDDKLSDIIFDFSLDLTTRIKAFEKYYELHNELTIELMCRMTGMYQFSGTKNIEKFLLKVCKQCAVSSLIKLEAAKSLLNFTEDEEIINDKDDEKMKDIKTESNTKIRDRNNSRKYEAYKALDSVCYCLDDLPSPCKVEAVCYLMESEEYKKQSLIYFCEIINDSNIDCDFRYKAILSIEAKKDSKHSEKYNIQDREYFLKNSCIEFLNNNSNYTMYRILAGQYLLQKLKIDAIISRQVQNTLLSFAEDENLDINLRADAADTLLNLGENHIKDLARNIIMILGRHLGGVKTVFNNAQNVHVTEVEESVKEILWFLTSFPTLEVEKKAIEFEYVETKIKDIIKKQKEEKIEEIKSINPIISYTESPTGMTGTTGTTGTTGPVYVDCSFCMRLYKEDEIENIEEKKIGEKFYCSEICFKEYDRIDKILISLNRINIDRILYSKYNQTLSNILIKVWSFLTNHESQDEMIKRLLEELYETSGTCSSGFVTRMVNVLSGFSDYSIRISFVDQLIASFIGRMNSRTRNITQPNSIYYTTDKYKDILLIYMRNNNLIKQSKDMRDLKNRDEILEEFLSEDKEEKISIAIQDFADNVLVEMIDNDNYDNRSNFVQFFADNLPSLRQELYEEYKEYMSDSEFDLTIRKAISEYEGMDFLI
jgi:hypothetical protein